MRKAERPVVKIPSRKLRKMFKNCCTLFCLKSISSLTLINQIKTHLPALAKKLVNKIRFFKHVEVKAFAIKW